MVTFCTGSVTAKRRAFKAAAGIDSVCVDNDEVIASFTLDKRLYVVVGDIPYGNMTLEQYVACSRALKTRLPLSRRAVREMLVSVGLTCSPKRKLNRVSRIGFRAATLAVKTDECTRRIYVNFDGLEYSRKNGRLMKRAVGAWVKNYEVYVAVSDARFITRGSAVVTYGDAVPPPQPAADKSKIGFRALKKKLAVYGMDIKLPKAKRVVVCET